MPIIDMRSNRLRDSSFYVDLRKMLEHVNVVVDGRLYGWQLYEKSRNSRYLLVISAEVMGDLPGEDPTQNCFRLGVRLTNEDVWGVTMADYRRLFPKGYFHPMPEWLCIAMIAYDLDKITNEITDGSEEVSVRFLYKLFARCIGTHRYAWEGSTMDAARTVHSALLVAGGRDVQSDRAAARPDRRRRGIATTMSSDDLLSYGNELLSDETRQQTMLDTVTASSFKRTSKLRSDLSSTISSTVKSFLLKSPAGSNHHIDSKNR